MKSLDVESLDGKSLEIESLDIKRDWEGRYEA
jgi:hypothetical protein